MNIESVILSVLKSGLQNVNLKNIFFYVRLKNIKKCRLSTTGLEPAISCFVDRRRIHWATRTLLITIVYKNYLFSFTHRSKLYSRLLKL